MLSPDPKNYVVCEVEHPPIVHKTVFPKSSKFRWGCQKTRSENTQYSLKSHFQPREWTFPAKQGDQPAFGMKYAYINAITTERPHMQTGGRQAMTQGSCRQLTQGHFLLEGAWERLEDSKSLLHQTGEHLTYCLSLDLETKGLKKNNQRNASFRSFRKTSMGQCEGSASRGISHLMMQAQWLELHLENPCNSGKETGLHKVVL